jgi:acetolactate synthase-1/2/3 large subunit
MLADSFNWHGHIVRNSVDLPDTLNAAFEEEGPSLVVLPIDYSENMKLTERLGNICCPI